jgi:hypothetical protein
LPLSRDYIATKLDTLSYHTRKLTPLEQEELIFYRKDYTLENNTLQQVDLETPYKSVVKTRAGDRFRVASYQDKQFAVNAQPILGYESEFVLEDGSNISRSWKGAWLYGYLGKHVGFSFNFVDYLESGLRIDKKQTFEPSTGLIISNGGDNQFNHNSIIGNISTNWKWGTLTLGKDYMPIGYGAGGKLILSQRAPAFPMIRLDITPVKWLSFNYAHIWLNSNVIDTTSIRPSTIPGNIFFSYRDKFLVTHSLSFKPYNGINVMVGESAIYSDKLQIAYFIPVMFFTALDHYLGGINNNSLSNSQLFLQLSSRNNISKTHLYGSFFIDEMRIKDIFSPEKAKNHTGYTLGASVADFPVNNISLQLEYTRIRPFVYENYQQTQTYASEDYTLGHWIGSNADQLYMSFLWRMFRGAHLQGSYSFVRKGDKGTPLQQREAEGLPFLFGTVNTFQDINIDFRYEVQHDLFVKMGYSTREQTFGDKITKPISRERLTIGINFGF